MDFSDNPRIIVHFKKCCQPNLDNLCVGSMRFFIQNGDTSQSGEIRCSTLFPLVIALSYTMYFMILTNTIKYGFRTT